MLVLIVRTTILYAIVVIAPVSYTHLNAPEKSVVLVEKGHAIVKRVCPIVAKKVQKCIKCESCAIMEGMACLLYTSSTTTLVGTSPDNIRHFVELRGIGIVNVRRIFGIGSVKMSEKVDMIIHLEPWEADKNYDRIGLENTHTEILGIKIPSLTIPVKPGRNLAIIIEVAAMNNRQKRMGYNAARQLLTNLGMIEDVKKAEEQDVDLF